ncbi:MAG: glycosyltransferase [Phycisphaerales bacterium]|nr:MAG: glycosyltransferase [Phycisphaerales bacterium]
MKNVLMIFDQFPPYHMSGSARSLYFAKHLSEFGYYPTVIAGRIPPKHEPDDELMAELDGRCKVLRTEYWSVRRLVNALRHPLRIRHSPSLPADLPLPVAGDELPPHWTYLARRMYLSVAWTCPAVCLGMRTLLRTRSDIIWATGPAWSNLLAGYWLSVLTGTPLVADLRDPWTYGVLWKPPTPALARIERRWETRVLRRADRTVFTSPLTTAIMRDRIGPPAAQRFVTITNGFTEANVQPRRDWLQDKCLFRYVGRLFEHRDPALLLEGLRLACHDPEVARDVRVQFIGGMSAFEPRIAEFGLQEQVDDVGAVSRRESLEYMQGADVLVLLQTITGPGRDVVSGKAFEYIGAHKPILAIVPEDGGDAWLIRTTRSGTVSGLRDPRSVADGILRLWRLWKQGRLDTAAAHTDIARFSRRNLTRQLALHFDDVLSERRRVHRPHPCRSAGDT